jgi:hypothetical protein
VIRNFLRPFLRRSFFSHCSSTITTAKSRAKHLTVINRHRAASPFPHSPKVGLCADGLQLFAFAHAAWSVSRLISSKRLSYR